MAKFLIKPTIPVDGTFTARLGAGTGSSNWIDDKEVNKLVKLGAESRYVLCAAGDKIEAQIVAVESATLDNYSIGTVQDRGRLDVTCDGLEATAGTGTIAVGDYVVCGTVVAKGTALSAGPKVCKATNQPGATVTTADNVAATINAAIAKVVDAGMNTLYAWRVKSLGSAGTGAVGTAAVIERVAV